MLLFLLMNMCHLSQSNHLFIFLTLARGYKKFSCSSHVTEHEILNAHKYKNIKKFRIFQAQINLEGYFSCSNVKMPTIVGILTFMIGENFMLLSVKFFYNLGHK